MTCKSNINKTGKNSDTHAIMLSYSSMRKNINTIYVDKTPNVKPKKRGNVPDISYLNSFNPYANLDFIFATTSSPANVPYSTLRIHSCTVDSDYDTTGCVPLLANAAR